MKFSSSVVTTSSTPKRVRSNAGTSSSTAPASDRGAEHRRKQERSRQIETRAAVQAADGDGGERARVELALGADVPEPSAKRDRSGKPGQHSGVARVSVSLQAKRRAESARKQQRVGFADRRARPSDEQHRHAEREGDGGERRDDECRARARGARLKPHAHACDEPAIARPISARVHSPAGRAA